MKTKAEANEGHDPNKKAKPGELLRTDILPPLVLDPSPTHQLPTPPQTPPANIFDRFGSDVKASMDYNEKFKSARVNDAKFSYLLIDLGNRLLQIDSIKRAYKKIKNPIKAKIDDLQSKIPLYEAAAIFFSNKEASNINEIQAWVNNNSKLKASYASTLQNLRTELSGLEEVFSNFTDMHPKLSAAFPLLPKKLTESVINDYKQHAGTEDSKLITQQLLNVRSISGQSDGLKDHQEEKEFTTLYNINSLQKVQYKGNEADKKNKSAIDKYIKSAIGREPNNEELENYVKKNKSIDVKNIDSTSAVNNAMKYIMDNREDIFKIMEKLAILAIDSDYLKLIETQDFLTQVRTYRKLNFTVGEFLCKVQGQDGSMVVPPGRSCYMSMNDNGTVTTKSVAFQKYSDLTKQSELLKNYKSNYFDNSQHNYSPQDEIFHSTFQIEAIRSTSALLTIPMFFDLALSTFKPLRISAKIYDFKNIAEQMPMAMEGAVSGAVYLEKLLSSELSGDFSYDYRDTNESSTSKTNGKSLDKLNTNLLFDWLCQKSGITEVIQQIENSKPLDGGWEVTDDTEGGCIVKKGDYSFVLSNKKIEDTGQAAFELQQEAVLIANSRIQYKKDKYSITKTKEDSYTCVGKETKKEITFNLELVNGTIKVKKFVDDGKEVKRAVKAIEAIEKCFEIKICGIALKETHSKDISAIVGQPGKYKINEISCDVLLDDNSKIVIKSEKSLFYVKEIKNIPPKVFNELFSDWYKVEISELNKHKVVDMLLKAAAEPKDPDINRDQDEATAILLKNTKLAEQSDDNFNIDQKVNNKIAEELTKSTQTLNINDLIGEGQAFNNVIDPTLLNTPLELLGFGSELIVI